MWKNMDIHCKNKGFRRFRRLRARTGKVSNNHQKWIQNPWQKISKNSETNIKLSWTKNQAKSAHGAPNGRKGGLEQWKRSAILPPKVPQSNKKSKNNSFGRQVITHASRPEGPANSRSYTNSHDIDIYILPYRHLFLKAFVTIAGAYRMVAAVNVGIFLGGVLHNLQVCWAAGSS